MQWLTWRWIAVALAAVVVLRIGGLIGNFWTALGVFGFLVILGLLQTLPAFKKFATTVFIVWAVFSFGLPILGITLQTNWPILGEARQRRSLDSETRSAEWMDPIAYRARVGLARYCKEIDQIQGAWVAIRLGELRQGMETPRLGFPGQAFPLPDPDREHEIYKKLELIEKHRLECRALVLKTTFGPAGIWQWITSIPETPRRAAFWGVVIVLIALGLAAALVRLFGKKSPVGAVAGLAMLLLAALLADWLIWGNGWQRLTGAPAVAQPVAPPAIPSPHYFGTSQVTGSMAPRPTRATLVTPKGPGHWEIAIDGTNEVGYKEPAPGHRTAIKVQPGETAIIRHLGGTPAINVYGDRVALCGITRRIRGWERFRFPEMRLYAVGADLSTSGVVERSVTAWRCGEDELKLRNGDPTTTFELVLWFNTNETYKGADGQIHNDGFAYAGYDGERTVFEVRLVK